MIANLTTTACDYHIDVVDYDSCIKRANFGTEVTTNKFFTTNVGFENPYTTAKTYYNCWAF